MLHSLRSIAGPLRTHCRALSRSTVLRQSVEAAAASPSSHLSIPVPEGVDKPGSPKLVALVNQISHLSLLEVSELSALLKKTLNLPDAAMMPAMSMMPNARSAGGDDEEEVAAKKVQTEFKVKLIKFDDKQKVALIKEVKNLLEGMNLVQAKKFVESAPTIVKQDIPKEEAEKLRDALVKAGAVIEIE